MDEFGQLLTAIGSMVGAAGTNAPEAPPLRADLQRSSDGAQTTLDSRAQSLESVAPVMLDEADLEKTDRLVHPMWKGNGNCLSYERRSSRLRVAGGAGVHHLCSVQEALNQCGATLGSEKAGGGRWGKVGRRCAEVGGWGGGWGGAGGAGGGGGVFSNCFFFFLGVGKGEGRGGGGGGGGGGPGDGFR